MHKTPLVSVLMPAYNAERYIDEAVQSILNQSFKDFELIILNDGSTDKTWSIVQKYASKDSRIVAVSNTKNMKLSRTLNRGINMAKGKYIARMDADDISLSNRLRDQYHFMETHPQVGISGGSMNIIDTSNKVIGKRDYHLSDVDIREHIFKYSPFSHPLIIIRKSVLDKVGYYNPDFNPAEDYELYFRIGTISQFANLPIVLLRYRVVPKSMTTGATKYMELLTIKIRKLYAQNLKYHFKISDRVYNIFHYLSIFILPDKVNSVLKIWIFNKIRNSLITNTLL